MGSALLDMLLILKISSLTKPPSPSIWSDEAIATWVGTLFTSLLGALTLWFIFRQNAQQLRSDENAVLVPARIRQQEARQKWFDFLEELNHQRNVASIDLAVPENIQEHNAQQAVSKLRDDAVKELSSSSEHICELIESKAIHNPNFIAEFDDSLRFYASKGTFAFVPPIWTPHRYPSLAARYGRLGLYSKKD